MWIIQGPHPDHAVEAAIAGLAGFLLPFMIVFVPGLTFSFSEPVFAVLSLIACPLIFIGLQPAIVGFFLKRLDLKERVVVFLSPVALLMFIYNRNSWWFVLGLGILCAFVMWQVKMRKAEKMALA